MKGRDLDAVKSTFRSTWKECIESRDKAEKLEAENALLKQQIQQLGEKPQRVGGRRAKPVLLMDDNGEFTSPSDSDA